ncbi:MAG: DUF1989 domain-containing protein [Rhodospirillales bacterium]
MLQAVTPPDARPRSRRPGFPAPGQERHRAPGGGGVVFTVEPGDIIRVVDPEGGQPGEITAFGPNGRVGVGLLGAKTAASAESPADGLFALLQRNPALAALLRRHNLNPEGATCVWAFSKESPAGAEEIFTADAACAVCVCAPGGPMAADGCDPPTELTVFITRARAPNKDGAAAVERLPDPLAAARIDQRINARTAAAYEVKAGEWIQVIDVSGRQCSDFQAFASALLERGVERPLDATTTRTLMGQGYPAPGNLAKYYDQDMRPVIEIVQDTVSRHDAFGLACTAKYYDDLGYPGHVNCSENFNAALKPYGVEARPGWMAMNFFYNTGVDAQNAFGFDEPWSRPGDFVMLRALTDTVCVSSACPCDVDPANGWDPTDIHVRVYEPGLEAPRSIGFRRHPDKEPEMTKETGFHPRTSALTRDFAAYSGFWIPNSFVNYGPQAEYWAARERAIIMDLSALRKFEITGPDAEELCQRVFTRDVRRLSPGGVVYSVMCHETGTMIDDGTLFRMTETNFRWIGGVDKGGEWLREQAAAAGLDARVKSSTDELHNIAVQGPLSREILKSIIWSAPTQPDLEELQWFRFAVARIGDFDGIPIVVSRTGYSGELGYEIFCHPKDAPEVWDAVWAAGEPHGMAPLGLAALDMLRIEAGLVFAGQEFDEDTDPFEAGVGFTVALKNKQDDFIGRAALTKRKANPQRKLVGLELAGGETAAAGDPLYDGRHKIGVVTSAVKSPVLSKNIALARIAAEYAGPGREIEVGKLDGDAKRLAAVVTAFPHYDPKKERPRS